MPLGWLMPLAFLLAPWRRGLADRRTIGFFFCVFAFAVLASGTGIVSLGLYGGTIST